MDKIIVLNSTKQYFGGFYSFKYNITSCYTIIA